MEQGTMYICPEALLGNCLRNISSCYIIAKHFNFNLLIDMTHNGGIRPKEHLIIHMLLPEICRMNCDNKYIKYKYREVANFDKIYFNGTNTNLICEGRFTPKDRYNFGIESMIFNTIPGNMTNEEFISEKIKFYKQLTFPSDLVKCVNNFKNKHDLANCIGVHIRYTDNIGDRGKSDYYLNTNFETFFNKINTLSNEKLLICSDNAEVIKNLKESNMKNLIFADECILRVIEYQKYLQPFYEMMLLSNTKLIIGSSSSTFSYEAAFFNGTDIELYEEKGNTKTSIYSHAQPIMEWKLYELSKYK